MRRNHLVASPIFSAQRRHRLAPSKISAPMVQFGRMAIPAYLKYALAFHCTQILMPEKIIGEIRDFQASQSRLIVALRHPYGDEPQLMFHVFENMIPRLAKKLDMPLRRNPGLRLLHDYAVPLWSNAFIRFLLPRAGAMPVYHVKCDTGGLNNIRAVLKDGENPIGLAPEGQISYHSETLPRIEHGTVRMGFWCASDLERAGRTEEVRILPLSVHYQYDKRDFHKIHAAVSQLESLCGLAQSKNAKENLSSLLPRLREIEWQLLIKTESFYSGTYSYRAPEAILGESEAEERQRRWNALLPAALSVAEHALGIDPGQEDLVQRMYRVRLEGWARVYPEEALDSLSPLELAFADRRAGEGWFAMRHMELVDLMSYHDVTYLAYDDPAPSDNRIVESVLNLQDLCGRLMGGNITNRPNNIRKKAYVVPGEILNLSALLPQYRSNPKQTTRLATESLAKRFVDCIERYHHETD